MTVRVEDLPPFLVHDPELAHHVFDTLVNEVGARSRSYSKFLKTVRTLADMLGVIFVNPYDGEKKSITVTMKAPKTLIARIDEIARELGVSRSEVVRLALTITVLAWDAARTRPQAISAGGEE